VSQAAAGSHFQQAVVDRDVAVDGVVGRLSAERAAGNVEPRTLFSWALDRGHGLAIRTWIGDLKTFLQCLSKFGEQVGAFQEQKSHAGVDDGREASVAATIPASIHALCRQEQIHAPQIPVSSVNRVQVVHDRDALDRPKKVIVQSAFRPETYGALRIRRVVHVATERLQCGHDARFFFPILRRRRIRIGETAARGQREKPRCGHRTIVIPAPKVIRTIPLPVGLLESAPPRGQGCPHRP
jgi:hypothetical protein